MKDKPILGSFTRQQRAQRFLIKMLIAVSLAYLTDMKVAATAPQQQDPELLTYEELIRLYEQETPPEALKLKLETLLSTPFVNNAATARGVMPLKPQADDIGKFLRIVSWNIEQGLNYEAIERALAGPAKFSQLLDESKYPPGSERRELVLQQAAQMKDADVIVLNEVDWGMKRSNYRHVGRDLAMALGMNYVYGVEFVEVDPVALGIEKYNHTAPFEQAEQSGESEVDPTRYRGLHGTAILSRYPLENARIVPFRHQSYDWYEDELRGVPGLEQMKRRIGQLVFKKTTERQVRRGGRMMMLADIVDAEIPTGRMTIVATHLEARAEPRDRVQQLEELLTQIKDIEHPVVVAGDLNTSGRDAIPTTVRSEIKKQFSRVPLLASNPESKFFRVLRNFRFGDGGAFDFRGTRERSVGGSTETLSNSNQRDRDGFVSTSGVERSFGFIGRFKVDWIFVKPVPSAAPSDKQQSYRFAPHFGRTLAALNYSVEGRISDHNPIMVDLPFLEPRIR